MQEIVLFSRQLTENISNWAYYPQLGISIPQLGIIYPIGDYGFPSQVKQTQITNPQYIIVKISPIGYLKYPIGDIIPNWVFPLLVL